MRVLSAVLMTYYFLIIIGVLLSWVQSSSPATERFKQIIHQITDPYMSHFRGISWLQFKMLDLSPLLGLIIITFALFLTQKLSVGSFPSIGELLEWIIVTIWGIVAFLIALVAIVMIVRLITLYSMKGERPNWIDRIDAFLFPRVSRIMGVFTGKTIAYPVALGVSASVLLIFVIGIQILIKRVLIPFILQL